MSKYKILANAASAASKASWLSRVFSGSKAALSGVGKFLGNPWVTAAFIGYDIYSMFSSDEDQQDPASILANAGRAKDVTNIFYPPSILRCLTTPMSDSQATSLAFVNCFLKAANSSDPLARLRSVSYATMADYLLKSPDMATFVYSADKTADLLDELSEIIESNLEGADAEQVKSLALSGSDIASSPLEARRVLDYTAHLVTVYKKETGDE